MKHRGHFTAVVGLVATLALAAMAPVVMAARSAASEDQVAAFLADWQVDITVVYATRYSYSSTTQSHREEARYSHLAGAKEGGATWDASFQETSKTWCHSGSAVGNGKGTSKLTGLGGGFTPGMFGLDTSMTWQTLMPQSSVKYTMTRTNTACADSGPRASTVEVDPTDGPVFLPGTWDELGALPVGEVISNSYVKRETSPRGESTLTVTYTATRKVGRPLTLKVDVDGDGRVVGTGKKIDCGKVLGKCKATYPQGKEVVLAALEGDDAFLAWEGCDSVRGRQCRVKLSEAREVTARFGTGRPFRTGHDAPAIACVEAVGTTVRARVDVTMKVQNGTGKGQSARSMTVFARLESGVGIQPTQWRTKGVPLEPDLPWTAYPVEVLTDNRSGLQDLTVHVKLRWDVVGGDDVEVDLGLLPLPDCPGLSLGP